MMAPAALRLLVPLAVLACGGCSSALVGPAETAEPFVPPLVYAEWWRDMEACSGRSRAPILWFRVETDSGMTVPGHGGRVLGYWRPGAIYLAASVVAWRATVAHEMLHALLNDGTHDSPLFTSCFVPEFRPERIHGS